jgi:hypothetical protein
VVVPPGDPDALGIAMNVARHLRPDRAAMRGLAAKFTLESSSQLYLSKLTALVSDARRQRREKMRSGVRVWHEGGV